MAHLIDMSNQRANMAYVGVKPWHGLGSELERGAPLDVWCKAAGLDWEAKRAAVQYQDDEGNTHQSASEILYRSDTRADLGIVTSRYNIVQPAHILEFFRDLVGTSGLELETAGSLDGGRKVWALAQTGDSFRLRGQDEVRGYLLLATSFDGTLATRAQFTSVRVVCNNTLKIASADSKGAIVVPHSATFDAHGAKVELGLLDNAFADFEAQANVLAERRMTEKEAVEFYLGLMCTEKELEKPEDISTKKKNIVAEILGLYHGKAYGSQFSAAQGTAWGAVNAFTQYIDHKAGRNENNRFKNAQFGPNAELKVKAFNTALALAA